MTQKNSDHLFESLSALMDGEASELEFHRVLKQIEDNTELRHRWQRYHLISSIMKKKQDYSAGSETSLVASISKALSDEETYGSSAAGQSLAVKQKPSWWNLVGKTAVAASFTAACVLAIPALKSGDNQSGTQALMANAGPQPGAPEASSVANGVESIDQSSPMIGAPSGFEVVLPEARVVSTGSSAPAPHETSTRLRAADIADPQVQALLNRLLMEHANRASMNSGVGVLPYARVSRMEDSMIASKAAPASVMPVKTAQTAVQTKGPTINASSVRGSSAIESAIKDSQKSN